MTADQTPVCASRCSCCSECAGPSPSSYRHSATLRAVGAHSANFGPIRRDRHAELRVGGVRVQIVERPWRLQACSAHHPAVCVFLDEQQLLLMQSAQGVGILPGPAA